MAARHPTARQPLTRLDGCTEEELQQQPYYNLLETIMSLIIIIIMMYCITHMFTMQKAIYGHILVHHMGSDLSDALEGYKNPPHVISIHCSSSVFTSFCVLDL